MLQTMSHGYQRQQQQHQQQQQQQQEQQTSSAFVPLSERVLAACVALANTVASALQLEQAPTVLPKLARLAPDIVMTAPPPALPPHAVRW